MDGRLHTVRGEGGRDERERGGYGLDHDRERSPSRGAGIAMSGSWEATASTTTHHDRRAAERGQR
jgi:hypothetical protein